MTPDKIELLCALDDGTLVALDAAGSYLNDVQPDPPDGGVGGAAGAGGTPSGGGSSGSDAGVGVTGGASGGVGGSGGAGTGGGAAGGKKGDSDSGDDGGCGCRAAGRDGPGMLLLAGLILLIGALRRRRS